MLQKETVMETNRTNDRFRDSNAAPVAIVAAVVIALTSVTCVAGTLACHASARSKGTTTVAASSSRVQHGFATVAHQTQLTRTSASTNKRPGAETGTIEAPRECDLRQGIDSACIFN
jgi:hypothetical protein